MFSGVAGVGQVLRQLCAGEAEAVEVCLFAIFGSAPVQRFGIGCHQRLYIGITNHRNHGLVQIFPVVLIIHETVIVDVDFVTDGKIPAS